MVDNQGPLFSSDQTIQEWQFAIHLLLKGPLDLARRIRGVESISIAGDGGAIDDAKRVVDVAKPKHRAVVNRRGWGDDLCRRGRQWR